MADPVLAIPPDKVCHVIVKAREFDVQDVETDPDSGSNPADDGMVAVLEEHADDPTRAELVAFIDGLPEDEQIELVALAWLGRGEGDLGDWMELCEEARNAHNARTAAYLLGEPRIADYLEEGLSAFGQSCADFERDHL